MAKKTLAQNNTMNFNVDDLLPLRLIANGNDPLPTTSCYQAAENLQRQLISMYIKCTSNLHAQS